MSLVVRHSQKLRKSILHHQLLRAAAWEGSQPPCGPAWARPAWIAGALLGVFKGLSRAEAAHLSHKAVFTPDTARQGFGVSLPFHWGHVPSSSTAKFRFAVWRSSASSLAMLGFSYHTEKVFSGCSVPRTRTRCWCHPHQDPAPSPACRTSTAPTGNGPSSVQDGSGETWEHASEANPSQNNRMNLIVSLLSLSAPA